MIQDIAPSRLNNSWQSQQPTPDSFVMCFREGKLLAAITESEPHFPRYMGEQDAAYLFSVDEELFFLADISEIPAGYQFNTIRELRDQCAGKSVSEKRHGDKIPLPSQRQGDSRNRRYRGRDHRI